MTRYSTRLVDVERAREVDPGVELELVLGLELVVVDALEAEDDHDEEDRQEVDPEDREDDLASACSLGALPAAWRSSEMREVDGEGDEDEHGGHQPVLALAGEADGEDGEADEPRAPDRAARG